MNLRRIHIDIHAAACWSNAEVIHKTASYFKKDFHTIYQEKYDYDEEEDSISAIEDAMQCVFVAKEIRW